MVLDAGADEPDGAGRALDEQAAAGVDGDLAQRRVVDVVVGRPQPHVLEVDAGGGLGDVHAHVRGDAGLLDVGSCGGRRRRGRAVRDGEVGAREPADARVDVPQAAGGAGGRGQVPLDQHGAGGRALGRHDHVGPFDAAARLAGAAADLDDGLRGGDVGPVGARGHEDRVGFADDAEAGREVEGLGELVGAGVDEERHVVVDGVGDGVLEGRRVVRLAVAASPEVAGAVELGGGEVGVLRLRELVVLAAAQERGRTSGGGDGAHEVVGTLRRVRVALTPGGDGGAAGRACEGDGGAGTVNDGGDVADLDLVQLVDLLVGVCWRERGWEG